MAYGPDADARRTLPTDLAGWLAKLIGIVMTVLALSLAAPVSFDLIGKLAHLRSSGPPPTPSSMPIQQEEPAAA